ncbi:MAG: dephospho-CoA kinase [Bacteroidota bacterium]
MIVGLTGGIGSGKSTVANFFRELQVPVYDSDLEAKLLMVESEVVRKELLQLFGEEVYRGGTLNKTFISEIVFKDNDVLKQLNQIVHPAVRKHFEQWVAEQNAPYVIQETALVFENSMQNNYDVIIVVVASEYSRIQRVINRDGLSKAQVQARIKNQLPDRDKVIHADYTIENVDLGKTKEEVGRIHEQLLIETSS